VLGVGEIGLNKNTPNESKVFQQHVQLAIDCFDGAGGGEACSMGKHHLILIHTPHLEDKLKGTRMILEMLKDFGSLLDPSRILIDHVEEHTIKLVKDAGYWAGMTVYPVSKCTPQRAVDMMEVHGTGQLCVNAAADWGVSDPLQTHRTMLEARRRGHTVDTLMQVFHNNPALFFGQSPAFRLKPLKVTSE
jgi:hypothetical protein